MNPTSHIKILPFVAILLIFTQCATIKHQPFTGFGTAVEELRTGANKALQQNVETGKALFIEETAAITEPTDRLKVIENILIEGREGEHFSWQMKKEPLHRVSGRFREGVYSLNSTLLAYANLLSDLAGPALVSQQEFDEMTKEMNGNLMSGAKLIGAENMDKEIGIFSVAAIEAANIYFQQKSRKALMDILQKNQSHMERLSGQLQEAMLIASANLRHTYDERSMLLAEELYADNLSTEKRKKRVKALVQLNDNFIVQLKALKVLYEAYGLLPGIHNELQQSVKSPGFNLYSTKLLLDKGKHLYQLYQEMENAAN